MKLYSKFIFFSLFVLSCEACADDISQLLNKNMSQQAGGCPLVSFADKLPVTGGRETAFNDSCFIDLESIDMESYQVVDTRHSVEYQQGHMAGAINIALHQVGNKSFLKKKKILLVNNGFPQFELGQFCQILQEKGFNSVKVLRGGIHSWLSHGYSLEGDGDERNNIDVVKVEALMMDYDKKLVQIVNLKPENNSAQRIVSDAKLISLDTKKGELKNQLLAVAEAEKNTGRQVVVVLEENEYLFAKKLLNGEMLNNIYYLWGDKTTLNKFKQTRATINQARIDGPRVQHCGS